MKKLKLREDKQFIKMTVGTWLRMWTLIYPSPTLTVFFKHHHMKSPTPSCPLLRLSYYQSTKKERLSLIASALKTQSHFLCVGWLTVPIVI